MAKMTMPLEVGIEQEWAKRMEMLEEEGIALHQAQLRSMHNHVALLGRDIASVRGEVTSLRTSVQELLHPHRGHHVEAKLECPVEEELQALRSKLGQLEGALEAGFRRLATGDNRLSWHRRVGEEKQQLRAEVPQDHHSLAVINAELHHLKKCLDEERLAREELKLAIQETTREPGLLDKGPADRDAARFAWAKDRLESLEVSCRSCTEELQQVASSQARQDVELEAHCSWVSERFTALDRQFLEVSAYQRQGYDDLNCRIDGLIHDRTPQDRLQNLELLFRDYLEGVMGTCPSGHPPGSPAPAHAPPQEVYEAEAWPLPQAKPIMVDTSLRRETSPERGWLSREDHLSMASTPDEA